MSCSSGGPVVYGLLGVMPVDGERAACKIGCVGAGHSLPIG